MNRAVGSRTIRADALAKVTGEARFVDDLEFGGMLHAAVVRSPHPHARIRSIDSSAALGREGVVAVATADDIPGQNVVHIVLDDQPLLAEGLVRYAGEPVAVIAATSRDIARAAVGAVGVDYEPLEPLLDSRESAGNAIRLFGEDNVFAHHRIRRGDVEAGFAEADTVVEGEYRTGYQEHAYLEPQGMIAVPEPDGAMSVYGSMQCPFYVQLALCDTLGVPRSKIRVVQTVTGGAFGGKEDVPSLVAGQAALLARITGRPVKLIYGREEDIAVTSKRHPARIRCRTGARKDGTLVAAEVDMLYDGGAYATLSPVVLWRATVHAVGAYRCPNVRVDARAVATNRLPCGAFRGFGSPQVLFAAESQMDRLAVALGLDRAEIRRRNLLRAGDETITGQVLGDSVGASAVLERALKQADWAERQAQSTDEVRTYSLGPPILDDHRRRGRGLSLVHYGSGLGAGGARLDRSGAFVQIHEDASVTAAVGTTELGQGMETVLGQIVAEELGVLPSDVRLLPADTSRVPDSGPTVASRATTCSGNALRDACAPLRRTLLEVAAEKLGVAPDAVDLLGGFARAGEKRVTIGEVVSECAARRTRLAAMGHHVAPPSTWNAETGQGEAYEVYAWAAVVADVVVDSATGETTVERIVAAHDVGRAINPTGVEAQIEGGSVQGVGYALCEELVTTGGIVRNPDFGTYVIPTAADAPRVEALIVEEAYSRGPHGAKGFGEQPLMGVAPAVISAIHDAVDVRLSEIPATPERVLAALQGIADSPERTEPGFGCSFAAAPAAALVPVRPAAAERVVPLVFRVNGVVHRLRVGVDETLLQVLRERLRLTGTKRGCGKGECGACTVLLDERPVNACLVLAAELQDSEVTTIEGLGADGLHPLQRAFVEHGAIQCGFCTPGLVLAAKALLDRDPDPDEATIRRGIAGNLCRCTGYTKVVAAIRAVAGERRS